MAKTDWNPYEEWVVSVLRTILFLDGCQIDVAPGKVAQFIVTPPKENPFAVLFRWENAPTQVAASEVQVFGHPMPAVCVWLSENPDRVAFEAPFADRILPKWRSVASRIRPQVIPRIPEKTDRET